MMLVGSDNLNVGIEMIFIKYGGGKIIYTSDKLSGALLFHIILPI